MSVKGQYKPLSSKEREWVEFMVNTGLGPIEAARVVFKWRCEPGSREHNKACDLARTNRIKKYRQEYSETRLREEQAKQTVRFDRTINFDKLRDIAYKKLSELANDPDQKSQTRFNAVKALESLSDPTKDVNLILRWVTLAWRGMSVHCPCCHETYPLWKIKNKHVENYIEEHGDPIEEVENTLERRFQLISRAEKRRKPHPGQIKALAAPERNIVGLAPARVGKSFLMAMLAYLSLLIPGVEIWILARVYEDARSEVEYLRGFLRSVFHPYTKHFITEHYDSKTGELTLTTKWESELRVKSAKSKGSITGRELELACIAEPGWVQEDIFNHLRARLSSRLGRMVLLGTPQGYGGILGRVVNLIGRDPNTKRIIRITPEQRTIEAGCAWNTSMLVYNLSPEDNPEYVKSELAAARMELTDAEYASEFEGQMSAAEGSKFHAITPAHCRPIGFNEYEDCAWVLGVDQGPKNFAWTLCAVDHHQTPANIYGAYESFVIDERTMKAHLTEMRELVPYTIKKLGGNPDNWKLTIFDTDPPLTNELSELELEGKKWPTEVTWKHRNSRNKYSNENWRKETYEYVNEKAKQGELIFDQEHCYLLHDQLMRVLNKQENPDLDESRGFGKGWEVNDPWRGDHVLDAFIFSMWTIMNSMVTLAGELPDAQAPYVEAQAAFEYNLAAQERAELSGYGDKATAKDFEDLWQEKFGRDRFSQDSIIPSNPSYYKDY